jgi:proteasome lid subunit RPN8/RPN11
MDMRVRISTSVLDAIRRESAIVAPREACGLLFGSPSEVTGWQAAENVAEDPLRRFEVDPGVLFAALRSARGGGPPIAGYWHSHPSGDATPSATDAAMAAPDGKLWLIVAGDAAAMWIAGPRGAVCGRFEHVDLDTA